MKLLIFGDVFGKLGRAGVKRMLPIWREKFSPDVVIANIENISHGKGIGIKQIDELREAGVNIFTGGNHSVEGKDFAAVLNDKNIPVTRPANMRDDLPGRGVVLYDVKSASEQKSDFPRKSDFEESVDVKLLVINLIGQVFMKQEYANPFQMIDKILSEHARKTPYIILDWHADASSEKNAMGWYLDGKVSLVYGTHSHVPTADARILPKGTAYISDIGMTGPHPSIIGAEIEPAFKRFRDQIKTSINPVEDGPIEVNAIYVELDDFARASSARASVAKPVEIRHLREIVQEYTI